MVKFNIFIASLSFLAGLANIFVGLGASNYSNLDLGLVMVQVILSALVVVSGLSKIKIIFSDNAVSSAHVYFAGVFYVFILVVIWFLA